VRPWWLLAIRVDVGRSPSSSLKRSNRASWRSFLAPRKHEKGAGGVSDVKETKETPAPDCNGIVIVAGRG
jgi:hypothetical protein